MMSINGLSIKFTGILCIVFLGFGSAATMSGTSARTSSSVICPPSLKPCGSFLTSLPIQGGDIIPADFITADTGLLSRLGKSFVVTIPTNSDAPVEVGGMKLSPRQLDPSGKGGTFTFTYKSQKKDLKGNTVFSFNVAKR